MAAYFWVGGTGTWSGTGNTQFAVTTGGAPTILDPTNADTVTFDANSGTAATVTVTATAVSLDTTINKADITILLSGSPTLCTGLCTLTAGTLNLNNFVLSTGRFNSSNANVRTITTGTGSFTITSNAATVWTTGNATNLTYTSGIPTVNATYAGATGTRVFSIAGAVDIINLNITAGADIIAPNSTFAVNNYNFTGFSGTLTNVSSIIYGSLTLSTGMTVSAGANTFEFRGVSGTNTITSAGRTMDFPITFNTAGVTWQLQDALTSGATLTCTLTAGTLDLNSYTLTTGLFSSNNSNTRTLAFGTGNITLTGVNTTIFTTSTATNMTITGAPVVNCTATTGTAIQTRIFTAGSFVEAQSISVNVNPGTSAVDIFRLATSNGSFKDVTFSSTFTGTVQIANPINVFGNLDFGGATAYTGTSTVTFAATSGVKTIRTNGRTFGGGVTFSGVGGAWNCSDNLSAAGTLTLTAGTFNLNSYNLTAAAFSSNNSNVRTFTQGSGSFTVTGSSATIWNTGTSTNLTYTTTPTINANYSGAVGSRTINTDATSPINLNVTAGTDTITNVAGSSFNNLNFTGFAGTLANVGRFIYGNLTLSAGMTLTAGTLITQFSGVGTATITSNTKTMDFPITFNGTGTTNCLDALTLGSTRALTFTSGTLNLFAGVTSTVGSFVTTGTTAKYLGSTTPGTQATISDASGTDTVSYLTIKDSNATGGATWNALAITNVDAGNNTGWLFSTTPSVSNEVTMRLRSFTQPRRF